MKLDFKIRSKYGACGIGRLSENLALFWKDNLEEIPLYLEGESSIYVPDEFYISEDHFESIYYRHGLMWHPQAELTITSNEDGHLVDRFLIESLPSNQVRYLVAKNDPQYSDQSGFFGYQGPVDETFGTMQFGFDIEKKYDRGKLLVDFTHWRQNDWSIDSVMYCGVPCEEEYSYQIPSHYKYYIEEFSFGDTERPMWAASL